METSRLGALLQEDPAFSFLPSALCDTSQRNIFFETVF
jgi:hypothetical protein